MSCQPKKYFQTTLIAISILVIAFYSEQVSASQILFNSLSEDISEVTLITDDGVQLSGNYYSTDHQRLVIILNGLFMSKDMGFKHTFCKKLSKKFDILNIDFRGHGRSSGLFTGGEKEILDIQAAVKFANDRRYESIGVIGFSFGGYMAIKGAALIPQIDSVATISAPYSIDQKKPKSFDQQGLVFLIEFGRSLLQKILNVRYVDHLPEQLAELKTSLESLAQPVLVIHGDWDTVVPYDESQTIFQLAKGEKRFVKLDRGSHAETISDYHLEKVRQELDLWFEMTLVENY